MNQSVEETNQQEVEVVEPVGPIDILQLQALYKSDGDMVFSHSEDTGRLDNVGNSYSADAYELYASVTGGDRSITFPLDGKYSTLSGTIAIRQNESHESLRLEFYNGDVLIGQTEMLRDGVRPIDFSVDVSGVVDLTLRTSTETSYGFAYTNGLYLE